MTAAICVRFLAICLLLVGLATTAVGRAGADVYDLSGGHSTIVFSWSHAGLSRHSGRIVGVEGTVAFDPTRPDEAHATATIDPTRISTGVSALDRLLRGPDFFDATAHPVIAFRSAAVTVTDERTGMILGDLTIRGVTRPVTLDVTWNFSGEHPLGLINPSYSGKFVSGFSARTRVRRSEWGLGGGAPLISDEVEIAIEVEAVRR